MMSNSGGAGENGGLFGEDGTVTGKKCPKGLYGTFCKVPFVLTQPSLTEWF
jgi:hypothetical protein